jgi:uncharacterized protein YgiM (DUF1202 family)
MHRPAMRAGWLALHLALLVAFSTFFAHTKPAAADTDLDVGGEARVSYTGGDSIRVRSEPSYSSSVLTSVPEGWLVSVLGGPIDDGAGSQWYQVVARGMTGYMVSDYLARPGSASSSTSGEVAAAATMYTTTSLNLRSSASLSASVLLVMPSGASVSPTGSEQNGFSQMTYQGTTGWASSQFLSSNPPGSNSGTVISNAWVIGGSLNLRASASTASNVLLVMPNGAQVGVTGSPQNGFTPVRYNGTNGWAYSQYLSSTQPGTQPTPGTVISTAWVIDGSLNLRSSPSTSSSVLLVMPNGAEVGVTGSPQSGFTPVRYNGTNGWAYSAYLTDEEPGGEEPEPTQEPGGVIETRYATSSLNLRAGAGMSFDVLTVIPSGGEVGITGSQTNGYFPVRYNGTDGYAAAQYLSTAEPTDPGSGNTGGLLVWPVRGDTWTIIQGYNGGTHQNRSETASYLYSFDIQKVAGASATAGTAVYAPASGTVLWTNGGLLIGMGNGYGIAMFHITIDGSIRSGTQVTQGQYVGFISAPGGVGYQVTPHIDLTLWRLPNGGGSPRISTPFTGQFAISGQEFAATGAWNTHGGTRFSP